MLISLTFSAGLEVNFDHLIATLKNVPLLAKALLANFVIVPIFGVLLVRLFALPPEIATGFLLMAIAPGVPFVLNAVRKRGGSLGLAVELAAVLPLLSIVTVPLTARYVLPAAAAAALPIGRFVVTLVLFQLVPLLAGIAIATALPKAAPRLARIASIAFYITVVFLLIVLAPKLVDGVGAVYGSRGIWAMLSISILAMLTGLALGGPLTENRRVLGMGTTLRNVGLCVLTATTSFPGTPVAAAVLTYLLIQFSLTTIVGIYFARKTKEALA
ncbi:MAG TPA: hypothetical protein VHX17_09565 [Candidatus Cybelea sp.]|nr:hypothetical protein [Candidatus Cybelea sp.]